MVSRYRRTLGPIFKCSFFCGVVLFSIGNVASFYPGVETIWFLCTALLLLSGILIGGRGYVVVAALMVAVSLFYSAAGYSRGVEHQLWLEASDREAAVVSE